MEKIIEEELKNMVYWMHVESVQQLAEDNLKRRLTDEEIKRFAFAIINNDKARWTIDDAVMIAAADAMENGNGQWDEFDKDNANATVLSQLFWAHETYP